jgi:hypothetical protein
LETEEAPDPTGFPHPPQNLSPGSFRKPQSAQGADSVAPHWAQNRLSSRLRVPQAEQSKVTSPRTHAIAAARQADGKLRMVLLP